jgi:UPF0755 protein
MRKLALFALLVIVAAAGAGFYIRQQLQLPYPVETSNTIVEIPRGMRARDLVGLLQSRNVVRDQYVTLFYLLYSGERNRLQAGEYQFDHPMTVREVIRKIASGNVLLHKFTVPEGLTLDDTAAKWQEQGFGTAKDFADAAYQPVGKIKDLDPNADSLEGYLFPETYSFPAHTSARQAVDAMVSRFKNVIERLEKEVPRQDWPLEMRDTVILASLIESEAAHEDERQLVASVYLNRLNRKVLLQCDPTVIYALAQADQYTGKLTLADLKFPSPFNTYVHPGLPPGPIMNPGYPSLRAAIQPAATNYLFFVRTIDGRHTFSENLAAHNRAVAAYRVLQGRKKP